MKKHFGKKLRLNMQSKSLDKTLIFSEKKIVTGEN